VENVREGAELPLVVTRLDVGVEVVVVVVAHERPA
jgi:hypothetical protein